MINDIASASERRFYYVSGQPVELWENSDSPFGWSSDDLEVYANKGAWELLFNALVLSSAAPQASDC